MYSFTDRLNGDELTLRPEGTAGVVRAAVEHSMLHDGGKRRSSTSARCSPRAPAAPLPAVPPGRSRGAGPRRAGRRCRGHPDVPRLWRDLGLADVRLEINAWAGWTNGGRTVLRWWRTSRRGIRRTAGRRRAPSPARQPAAHPGHQEPGDAGPGRGGTEAAGLPGRGLAQALRGRQGHARRRRPALPRQPAAGALSTTTSPSSSGSPTASARRARSAVAAATTGCRALSARPAPGIGWGLGIERVLDLLQQSGVQPPPAAPDAYAVVLDAAVAAWCRCWKKRAGVAVLMHAAARKARAA